MDGGSRTGETGLDRSRTGRDETPEEESESRQRLWTGEERQEVVTGSNLGVLTKKDFVCVRTNFRNWRKGGVSSMGFRERVVSVGKPNPNIGRDV